MFKNKFYLLVLGLFTTLALVACTAAQAVSPANVETQTVAGSPSRTITVVGSGKVSLTPDIGKITVGAEAVAQTVVEAKTQVDTRIKAIRGALKALGIEGQDIKTSNYSIYYERDSSVFPRYEGDTSAGQGVYHVSNTLEVTVRNIETVGSVLDAVVEAGANQVYGVYFTVSDNARWEGQAREKAIADARSRAEELARLTGVKLGKVVAVSEVIGGAYPVAYDRAAYAGMGGGADIAPGELEMSTQVQVVFEIE